MRGKISKSLKIPHSFTWGKVSQNLYISPTDGLQLISRKVQRARLRIAVQMHEVRVAALDAHLNLKMN